MWLNFESFTLLNVFLILAFIGLQHDIRELIINYQIILEPPHCYYF